MSEITENTLTAYLGPEFQFRLMWQLLVEPDYSEKIISTIAIEYFDDPFLKRLFIIILEYYKEFGKVPNLQNKSIHHAINRFKTPNNIIEEESLFSLINRIELYNQRIINKEMLHDGDVIQKATHTFIKQQEYRKIGEFIISKTKTGEIKNKFIVNDIEERFVKIANIGEEDDDCEEVIDGIDAALVPEFRKTIPTGIEVIDALTGGGLGKGEIGLILTPSGVGKTTILTKIANTAYEQEYNIAQIIFEDTKDQIKRKHYTIWSNIALSKLDENNELARERAHKKAGELRGHGKLVLKKFLKEDVTMKDVREWMIGYEKKWNIKFDMLVIDYLDCLESHKKSPDRNEAELAIVKAFEKLASDFDIPCWSAIQSNRSGFNAEYVNAQQAGGNIKRYQKAHFFMSVAKTAEQKEAQLANISILKARFAQDGQQFTDCIFNNDTMEIRIEDDRFKNSRFNKGRKKHDSDDIDKLESNMGRFHAALSNSTEADIIEKVNSETINDVMRESMLKAYLDETTSPKPKPTDEFTESLGLEEDDINFKYSKNILAISEIMKNDDVEKPSSLKPNTEFDRPLGFDAEVELTKIGNEEFNNSLKSELTKIATEGVTEGVNTNDGVNDGVIEGATEGVTEGAVHPEADFNENQIKISAEIVDVDALESMLIDPDEVVDREKNIHDLLLKQRESQVVIKKEK
jgi:replicative DNA helicase